MVTGAGLCFNSESCAGSNLVLLSLGGSDFDRTTYCGSTINLYKNP